MDVERGFQLVLLAVAGLLTFMLLWPYLSVILGAILLAYLLSTPYEWLAPKIGDRVAAFVLILSTLLVLLIPFVLIINAVLQGVGDLLTSLQQNEGLAGFEGLQPLLKSIFGIDIDGGSSILDLAQRGEILDLAQTALDTVGGISEAFVHLTILLFVWYYLLKDGDQLIAWIGDVFPLSPAVQSELFTRADEVMYAVVIGNFVVAVADGVMVAIALWVVGFSDIVFWLFVCVFLALIPLVGTIVVWVPASVYLVIMGDTVSGVMLFAYGLVVVGSVDNVLRLFLGAPDVGLEPAIFIVGVLTGLSLFGVMGIFYGPVVLVMSKVVYETVGQELKRSDAA